MAIRPSPAKDVARLFAELTSADALRRESAAARLAIIGRPAAARLAALAADPAAATDTRRSALHTLAGIDLGRAASVAAEILDGASDVICFDAIETLAAAVNDDAASSTAAFERLTALALDRRQPVERRLAGLSALDRLPPHIVTPIYDALVNDDAPAIVGHVAVKRSVVEGSLDQLVERGLPNRPKSAADALTGITPTTPVITIRRAIGLIRAKESGANSVDRQAWRTLRGQLHAALAARGSRLAVDDLSLTLAQEDSGTLPETFLEAATAIGDVTCLEPVAAAWLAAATGAKTRRDRLAAVFTGIVTRERLTRRHPALVQLLTRLPASAVLVASAPRTRPRATKVD